jgi:tripartite-type tricarboxylate transporter receptor subunit TctC
LAGAPAVAQNLSYPERPVRFLVGFVAGGAVDLTARTTVYVRAEAAKWAKLIRELGLQVE